MDTPTADRVALMSIKPKYARLILAGTKQIEFRKRRLAPDVKTIIIYSTLPVGLVVGTFTVRKYDIDRPTPLWNRHRGHAGISRQAYRDYYRGASQAVGIMVKETVQFSQPIRLNEIADDLRAPQSFSYLSASNLSGPILEMLTSQR